MVGAEEQEDRLQAPQVEQEPPGCVQLMGQEHPA